MSSPRPTAAPKTHLCRRRDLRIIPVRHRHEVSVVVKDPVGLQYHRMRADEWFVLDRLDGRTSIADLTRAYNTRFAPTHVRDADIGHLVYRFHRLGLLVSATDNQAAVLQKRRRDTDRQQWMSSLGSLLFIRFPGFDPEPLLRKTYPWIRPWLGRHGWFAWFTLVFAAAFILVVQSDRWMSEAATIPMWLHGQTLLWLAAVIGLSKALHELGHAIACKHYGGECHQIGPMLLVFTPALYCDTSDSWTLPSRWRRWMIGAAGIMVEITLASIAAIVWAMTGPGPVHVIASQVMVVCGISTALFNANPLLRYDGYYMLADAVDVPNLAQRSRALATHHLVRLCTGIRTPIIEPIEGLGRVGLWAYAIASWLYRNLLMLVIFWMLVTFLRPVGLESLGILLACLALIMLVFSQLKNIFRPLRSPSTRHQMKPIRLALSLVFLAGIAYLGTIPWPDRLWVSGRITPRTEYPVYVQSPGMLNRVWHRGGDRVARGAVIAELVDPKATLALRKAEDRVRVQRAKLDAIRAQAIDQPERLNEIESQQSMLEELESQRRRRQDRVDALRIVAPASGVLIDGPATPETSSGAADEPLTLATWSGTPSDAKNIGGTFVAGTELASVWSDGLLEAEFYVDQSDTLRFAVGADVDLMVRHRPETILSGCVDRMDAVRTDRQHDASRRDDAASDAPEPSPQYLVRVRLDDSDAALLGARVEARIHGRPRSTWERVWHRLTGLVRMR